MLLTELGKRLLSTIIDMKSIPIYKKTMSFYYQDKDSQLLLGDTFELLKNIKSQSVDLIFADPPYFLSNGGITCRNGKMTSVDKAKWDKIDKQSRFKDKHSFNKTWIRQCRRILKPGGSIWISGTLHNIYSVGMALEELGFKIINNVTWQKTNPPPNLACKTFVHSTETILWAVKIDPKIKYIFNYHDMKDMNGGKQMKDVWSGSVTRPSEKKEGKHPTQKPEYILERIILSCTQENHLVLDPFCGSSTTGVVAKKFKRRYVGIDNNEEYLGISQRRLEKVDNA